MTTTHDRQKTQDREISTIIAPPPPGPYFFDEMLNALERYPEEKVEIEIVEVAYPGDVFNANERGSFRVEVRNTGPLHLTGVTLRIKARNGATVANNSITSPFVSEFVTQELPRVDAHGGTALTVGSPLKLQAPNTAQGEATLVEATLEDWNADLNHILLAHSDPQDTVKGVFRTEIVGS